ncbi:MAG TPA: MBL fold metallo-hydrolase [Desulfomonilia bacterium]|nr:MBL fold metallo-hydrolase [Desulfomonilia bacterium]
MKRLVYCCLPAVYVLCCAGFVHAEGSLEKISDHVYAYAGAKNPSAANSFGANAGIVMGDKGILVVDTLGSAKEAGRFIEDIRKISDKPIRYVVDTHNHFDHTFGNTEFAAIGAAIFAQSSCPSNMRKKAPQVLKNPKSYGMSDEQAKAVRITYPDVTAPEMMRIDLGSVSVDILFLAPSHTDDSVLVFVPQDRVLFSGDVLFTDYYPFMGDGDMNGWVKTLDFIMTVRIDKIVPGHGPVSTKKDIADMKQYLLAFDRKAKELSAKSGDLDTMVAELKKSLPVRTWGDFLIKDSLQAKYLQAKN